MEKRIGEDLEANESEIYDVVHGFLWTHWVKPQKIFGIPHDNRFWNSQIARQKRRASRQGGYTKQYIWKQPLMMEIGSFVQYNGHSLQQST
jgi:hypothetical protein